MVSNDFISFRDGRLRVFICLTSLKRPRYLFPESEWPYILTAPNIEKSACFGENNLQLQTERGGHEIDRH
jgi:hypothetical protein